MVLAAVWSDRLRRGLLALSRPSARLERNFFFQRRHGIADSVLSRFPLERRLPGRAIDVGANIGMYTYAFARCFDAVEAFEPQPRCATTIEQSVRRMPHVRVHRIGLSDCRENATLHVPIVHGRFRTHQASGLASLSPIGGEVETLTIDLVPLDDFGFADASLIKIDVEGHERAVIAGAKRTIDRSRPTLIVEIEQRHLGCVPIAEVFAQIQALGYSGWFLRGDALEDIANFSYERDQFAYEDDVAAGRNTHAYINNFIFEPLDRRRPPLFAAAAR